MDVPVKYVSSIPESGRVSFGKLDNIQTLQRSKESLNRGVFMKSPSLTRSE